MPRWKASRLRHTDPMLLRPLSFADCSVSKPACKWTIFLKEHEVYDFTVEDFKEDCEALRQVRAKALSIESAPVRGLWRSKNAIRLIGHPRLTIGR